MNIVTFIGTSVYYGSIVVGILVALKVLVFMVHVVMWVINKVKRHARRKHKR